MSVHASVQTVNFAEARSAILSSVDSDQPIMLIGDPGIGKSALAGLVADEVKLPLGVLIGSTLDATDVGGLPTVSEKKGVQRFPLKAIREACVEPRFLLLDEVGTAPWPVQAAFLRLVFERWAGDDRLHRDTRLMLATNPEEQSPGGVPISAPLMGRVAFFRLRPTADEVLDHLVTLGREDGTPFERALREEATGFAYTARVMPELLQIDCPAEASGGNIPWGAPRAWERALRSRAASEVRGMSEIAKRVATAGSVGVPLAASYAAILEVKAKLPSIDEIEHDPDGAIIPTERTMQVGAASLVQRVADRNTWAAWIYASRLAPEMQAACAQILLKRCDSAKDLPHQAKGSAARLKVLRSIPKVA